MAEKLIAVFGATGQQGSSVVRALVKDNQYCVRAITRFPDSDKGKALKELGCEVVRGDFDDKESLVEATKGAYGVFGVTDYWATGDADVETQQGKNAVDACIKNNVKHLIFSGMEWSKKEPGTEEGQFAHFDSKAKVEDYIVEQKIPCTRVHVPCYMENFFGPMGPKKQEDGTFAINLPMGDVPLDLICVHHFGETIHAIFNNPQEYLGKQIGVTGGIYTIEEIAKLLSKHCAPAVVKDGKMSPEEFKALLPPAAKMKANTIEYFKRGFFTRDPVLTLKLDPNTPDLEQWIIENKETLRKQLGV